MPLRPVEGLVLRTQVEQLRGIRYLRPRQVTQVLRVVLFDDLQVYFLHVSLLLRPELLPFIFQVLEETPLRLLVFAA